MRAKFQKGERVRLVREHPTLRRYGIPEDRFGRWVEITSVGDWSEEYGRWYDIDNRFTVYECMLDSAVQSGPCVQRWRFIDTGRSFNAPLPETFDAQRAADWYAGKVVKLTTFSPGIHSFESYGTIVSLLDCQEAA